MTGFVTVTVTVWVCATGLLLPHPATAIVNATAIAADTRILLPLSSRSCRFTHRPLGGRPPKGGDRKLGSSTAPYTQSVDFERRGSYQPFGISSRGVVFAYFLPRTVHRHGSTARAALGGGEVEIAEDLSAADESGAVSCATIYRVLAEHGDDRD